MPLFSGKKAALRVRQKQHALQASANPYRYLFDGKRKAPSQKTTIFLDSIRDSTAT